MAKVSSFPSFIYCQKMGQLSCPAPPSFLQSVYHSVMEFLVFWLTINIYCILLLALSFLWGPRSRGLGEKGQDSAITLGPCAVEL